MGMQPPHGRPPSGHGAVARPEHGRENGPHSGQVLQAAAVVRTAAIPPMQIIAALRRPFGPEARRDRRLARVRPGRIKEAKEVPSDKGPACAVLAFILTSSFLFGCALLPGYADRHSPPTPTAASLSELDLGSFLRGLGELPAHLTIGSTTAALTPNDVVGLPDWDKYMYHSLLWDGSEAGEAMLFTYGSAEAAQEAYAALVGGFEETHAQSENVAMDVSTRVIADLGDQAQAEVVGMGLNSGAVSAIRVEVAFARCRLVADIRLDHPADLDTAVAYARRLDQALRALACR